MPVELLVVDLKGIHPAVTLDMETLRIENILMADETFNVPAEVDMLLGADVWAKIMGPTQYKNITGTLLQETALGYVLIGRVENAAAGKLSIVTCNSNMIKRQEGDIDQLHKLIKQFWETEELCNIKEIRSPQEEEVEQIFVLNHTRNKTGIRRYIVHIPIKENGFPLGDSREIALKRFYQLERRLLRNESLRAKYIQFMHEYENLGHMGVALQPVSDNHYYIPHHCVEKKFRVVFDASCKTSNGKSLNDIQMVGEKLQYDLIDQVMRFRRHKIAVVADVEKMFGQIQIVPSQWDLQRIFWREDPMQSIKEYWLKVVTYGMASSAHNAVRAMIQCGRDHSNKYPEAAKVIESDFYMDDCLTGADSEEKAKLLCTEIDEILKAGGFVLRHWASNSKIIEQMMENKHESEVLLSELDETKVLGLRWIVKTDEFAIRARPNELPEKPTKRMVLSEIARLYDPNGFVQPIIIIAKMFMQDIWREKNLQWDEQLPDVLCKRWVDFHSSIVNLNKFRIPRWLRTGRLSVTQVHGFCDASERAYGAVIYIRTIDYQRNIKVALLIAKTKVAPLLTVSIPRLELQAAELLARLWKSTMRSCELEGVRSFLWSDSMIVLNWLKKSPYELKTFVANRVALIQKNTERKNWMHVSTEHNPADLISRGMKTDEFLASKVWLHGPEWLSWPEELWPVPKFSISTATKEETEKEFKPKLVNYIAGALICDKLDLLHRYSSWKKIVHITAYIKRVFFNFLSMKNNVSKKYGMLSREELRMGACYWIKHVQMIAYRAEVSVIKSKNSQLPSNSKLMSLRPKLDEEEVLRVGGRIGKADCEYDMRYPIIIPADSRLCWLILSEAHLDTLHGGNQTMMHYIRNKYWIPKLRLLVKVFISRCVRCRRESKKKAEQIMADLPAERLRPARPFARTGVDLAGPINMRVDDDVRVNTRARFTKVELKGYVVVFVCLVTRAVHLEVVKNMTTQAFLNAFKRFVSTRGSPDLMFSDNGTNLVGANNEMKRVYETWQSRAVCAGMTAHHTKWHFITPAAPNEGGLWESAVKSMKYHLRRVLGPQKYSYEALNTLLKEIEAVLNSRPICAMSDDPTDMQALTPAHFLIGGPIILPMPECTVDVKIKSSLKLYNDLQYRLQLFWKRWASDYLVTLMQRPKWQKEQENLKPGQLVLIANENYPPTYWIMGRIKEVLPGDDSKVRKAIVQVSGGELTRPIRKLCVLPVDDEIQEYKI